jgi:hypothetical protein
MGLEERRWQEFSADYAKNRGWGIPQGPQPIPSWAKPEGMAIYLARNYVEGGVAGVLNVEVVRGSEQEGMKWQAGENLRLNFGGDEQVVLDTEHAEQIRAQLAGKIAVVKPSLDLADEEMAGAFHYLAQIYGALDTSSMEMPAALMATDRFVPGRLVLDTRAQMVGLVEKYASWFTREDERLRGVMKRYMREERGLSAKDWRELALSWRKALLWDHPSAQDMFFAWACDKGLVDEGSSLDLMGLSAESLRRNMRESYSEDQRTKMWQGVLCFYREGNTAIVRSDHFSEEVDEGCFLLLREIGFVRIVGNNAYLESHFLIQGVGNEKVRELVEWALLD